MSHSGVSSSTGGMLEEILTFIGRSSGLRVVACANHMEVTQQIDQRKLRIPNQDIEAVLQRQDQEQRSFLQINLKNGKKLLLTDQLVGFKPGETQGLDLKRLPRVVTTPDLLSVLEAIDDTLTDAALPSSEAEMLKKAYFAIVLGAENIGFNMASEREWVLRLIASSFRTSC